MHFQRLSYDQRLLFPLTQPMTSTSGTIAQVKAMVALLNSCGPIPLESEVVIAVPSLHLLSTTAMIRGDIAIAAEVRKLKPVLITSVLQLTHG